MADNFDWNVVLRIAMDGGPQTRRELETLQKAEQQLQRQTDQATAATNKQSTALKNNARDLASAERQTNALRYANYDLAQTLLTVSAAATAAGGATVVAFASQESAFTSVERTADGALGNIRDRLTELSTVLPYTFNELASIATLGNQLGIAAADLESFTTTVAQFSSVTGISTEEAALAFGKLGNLLGVLPQDYDKLASSITLVGRTTAATEAQIISVAGEIAPAAAAAGFAADQVIGLSGALASLKVPPERSRSTILQFFETLNNAVATGGKDLQNFATVVGVTAADLESMVRSGQGKDILTRFIGNVSASDTIEITQALQNLGLAGLRTNPTIRALAGNTKLLNDSLADGAQGYNENTELQRQMALVLDDLNTKWLNFVNAATNAAAALGSAVAPALGQLLTAVTDLLKGFQDFASSDIGQVITRMATGLVVAVAAWAGLRGGIALATGATLAFNTATSFLGGKGIVAGLVGLASAMGFYKRSADAGTAASINFANGFKAVGKATVIIGILTLVGQAFLDLGGTVQWVGDRIAGFGGFLRDLNWGGAFNEGAEQIRAFGEGIVGWSKTLPRAEQYTADFGDAAADAGGYVGDWGANQEDLNTELNNSIPKVRTLTDYANDLASVWDRAFDIRFGPQQTLDAIATSFQDIRDAAREAQNTIRSLNAEISGLNSDLGIQKYFLGIAESYGDEKRAAAIRAQIAGLEADLADKTEQRAKAQSEANKTLTGNSEAAIRNRGTILGLVQQYQAHIQALADSGLSTAQLEAATTQLEQDFITQATQLGFNRQELGLYTQSFRDVKVAIDNVPRDITVTANIDPAIQALNEFVAKAAQAGTDAVTKLDNNFNAGMDRFETAAVASATQIGSSITAALEQSMKENANLPIFTGKTSTSSSRSSSGGFSGFDLPDLGGYRNPNDIAYEIGQWSKKVFGWAEGGYTGPGGKYEAAGIVHRGEYVIPKHLVNQSTGLPYADAMGRLQRGAPSRRGYSGGGFVGGGGGNQGMWFSPMGQMQLQQALQVTVATEMGTIARGVNNSNANASALGAS